VSVAICCRSVRFQELASCRCPHSFPTRRSSDLAAKTTGRRPCGPLAPRWWSETYSNRPTSIGSSAAVGGSTSACPCLPGTWKRRSEEHTSELQSRVDLVCRLLLEKKTRAKQQ